MADGTATWQTLRQIRRSEILADQAEIALVVETGSVMGRNPAGFLTAVLQGVQAKRRQDGSVIRAVDSKYTAFFLGAVCFWIVG
jgi:hypothetical protein